MKRVLYCSIVLVVSFGFALRTTKVTAANDSNQPTYSADGKLLLSGSRDTTALLWSVPLIMKSLDEGR